MKWLLCVVILLVAGCAAREANPFPVGTPEYSLWERQEELEKRQRLLEMEQDRNEMDAGWDRARNAIGH